MSKNKLIKRIPLEEKMKEEQTSKIDKVTKILNLLANGYVVQINNRGFLMYEGKIQKYGKRFCSDSSDKEGEEVALEIHGLGINDFLELIDKEFNEDDIFILNSQVVLTELNQKERNMSNTTTK